jgi:hypothetical protein
MATNGLIWAAQLATHVDLVFALVMNDGEAQPLIDATSGIDFNDVKGEGLLSPFRLVNEHQQNPTSDTPSLKAFGKIELAEENSIICQPSVTNQYLRPRA